MFDSAIPWTILEQAPPSMGFPRQEYWRGWPFSSPGDLPNPGIEPGSHFLLQGIFPTQGLNLGLLHCRQFLYCSTRNLKSCCCFVAKTYPTLLRPHGVQPARLPCPWDFPAKNIGMGCHLLLQGFAQPRNQTLISCTAGRLLTTEPPGKTNQRVDDSICKN